MPLNFSAARSSRITKKPQHKNPLLKRSSSSPFSSLNQRKPIKRSFSKPETALDDDEDFFGDRLEDVGLVKSLATDLSLRDVAQIIQYVRSHMFDALPESGGFNSVRIAEILNFRKSLPPTATVAHVHAMTTSPTATEREIAELVKGGVVRRTVIPGRGAGGSSIGDGLVLFKDIEGQVKETKGLGASLADKFLKYLRGNPANQSISLDKFSSSEITSLMRSGFLTSSSHRSNASDAFSSSDSASSGTVTSISSIARAASGSVAAVGGEEAIYDAGGRGGIRRSSSQYEQPSDQAPSTPFSEGQELKLSLPGTGPYLKILTASRSHLITLLTKSRFREMPLYLLRERWDGGISADDPAAKAKKYRGEFTGVLPSRTKKWKKFYGLMFDWVLAECLGAGLVEMFETGSVGRADLSEKQNAADEEEE